MFNYFIYWNMSENLQTWFSSENLQDSYKVCVTQYDAGATPILRFAVPRECQ